jgi:hypothetical protein
VITNAQRRSPHSSRAWLAGLALACLTGCLATESFDPPLEPGLVAARPLPVTLSPEVRRSYERDYRGLAKTTFRVGRLLGRLFPGRDGDAFLSRVRSDLDIEWVSEERVWRARFVTSMNLQVRGALHRLDADVVCSAIDDPDLAGRRAIERGVEEIYVQAASLLRQPAR